MDSLGRWVIYPLFLRRKNAHWRSLFVSAAAVGGLACVVWMSTATIDRALAELIRVRSPPGFVETMRNIAAITMPLLSLTVMIPVHQYALSGFRDRYHANRTFILVLSVVLAELCIGLLHVVFGRTNPSEYFGSGEYGFWYLHGSVGDSSFPSAYAAGAAAIAATQWLFAQSYRPTIALLSAVAAAADVLSEQHFFSDVVGGFGVGIGAFLCLKTSFGAAGAEIMPPTRSTGSVTSRHTDDEL